MVQCRQRIHAGVAPLVLMAVCTCIEHPLQAEDRSPALPPLHVALYDDAGGHVLEHGNLEQSLPAPAFTTRRVSAQEIREGILEQFAVIVLPGGSGSGEARNLEPSGCAAIKAFIAGGHGYVGFCAGAYLASSHYPWSLHLINARVVDTAHWARGTGQVQVRWTEAGRRLLARTEETITCFYGQGPLLAPGADGQAPSYDTLATFDSEIARNGAPAGVMKGTAAIACGTYGKGRVWCFSPHPEKTEGLRDLVRAAVQWVAGRDAARPP